MTPGVNTLLVYVEKRAYARSLPDTIHCLGPGAKGCLPGIEFAERGDWLYVRADNIAGGTAKYVRDEETPDLWHRYSGLLSGEAPTVPTSEVVNPRSAIPVYAETGLVAVVPAKPVPDFMLNDQPFMYQPRPPMEYAGQATDDVHDARLRAFEQLRQHIEAGRIVVTATTPASASQLMDEVRATPEFRAIFAKRVQAKLGDMQARAFWAGYSPADAQAIQDAQARAIYGRDYVGMDELPAAIREHAQHLPPGSLAGGITWSPDYRAFSDALPPIVRRGGLADLSPDPTMSDYRAQQDRKTLRNAAALANRELEALLTRARQDKGERVGNYLDWIADAQAVLTVALKATASDPLEERREELYTQHDAGRVPHTVADVFLREDSKPSTFGGNGPMIGADDP